MKIIDIIEARTKPGMNPKVSSYEQLLKYKDDPNIYISFTHINKIGVNPSSTYKTPNGIYTFPLAVTWKMYDVDKNKDFSGYPFVNDSGARPYIQILSRNNFGQTLNFDEYTKEDLHRDIKKLRRIYDPAQVDELFNHSIDTARVQSPGGHIWSVTYNLTKNANRWSELFRKLGYGLIVDYNHSIIHPSEPCQAVFLTKNAFNHLGTAYNTRHHLSTGKQAPLALDRIQQNFRDTKERDPKVEKFLIQRAKPKEIRWYLERVVNQNNAHTWERWPEAEHLIMKDPLLANDYAYYCFHRPWPKAEKFIIKDPEAAGKYARYVMRHRWPGAEPMIKNNSHEWMAYVKHFPDADPTLNVANQKFFFEDNK